MLGLNDFAIAVGFDLVNGAQHGVVYNSHTGYVQAGLIVKRFIDCTSGVDVRRSESSADLTILSPRRISPISKKPGLARRRGRGRI